MKYHLILSILAVGLACGVSPSARDAVNETRARFAEAQAYHLLRKEAVTRGFAQHNPTTGEWEWKAPATIVEEQLSTDILFEPIPTPVVAKKGKR